MYTFIWHNKWFVVKIWWYLSTLHYIVQKCSSICNLISIHPTYISLFFLLLMLHFIMCSRLLESFHIDRPNVERNWKQTLRVVILCSQFLFATLPLSHTSLIPTTASLSSFTNLSDSYCCLSILFIPLKVKYVPRIVMFAAASTEMCAWKLDLSRYFDYDVWGYIILTQWWVMHNIYFLSTAITERCDTILLQLLLSSLSIIWLLFSFFNKYIYCTMKWAVCLIYSF